MDIEKTIKIPLTLLATTTTPKDFSRAVEDRLRTEYPTAFDRDRQALHDVWMQYYEVMWVLNDEQESLTNKLLKRAGTH